ncbi:Rpn family recombination-promoting nuclease/putative transposase [bacterium]|nr:Rpn family recombination-promoting nuclease/putative transposase [bacterium]
MEFLNPKTDFAFKRIFGSSESKEILISFLNAVLEPSEEETIVDLVIEDPYNVPKIKGMKDTYVDVSVTTSNGKQVIIEMQVLPVEGFEKRILYNAAKKYSNQLGRGKNYKELLPVIALTITDFVMFENFEKVVSKFILKEKEYLTDYTNSDLELVFVELAKFQKSESELESLLDKWLFFLKNAEKLGLVPAKLKSETQILRAFEFANKSQLSREELEFQEKKEIFIMDQIGAIIKAERGGFEKGVLQGIEQGKLEVAKSLLAAGMSLSEISKVTNLPENEIAKLET